MQEKKKILFISQYFYPETFRGNDIAFHWAEKGHDVHVVTGIPNYPAGKFHDGYGLLKRRTEVVKGVRVTRLPIFPRGNNKILLMLNYFSYLFVSWVYILFHAICNKYDCVFVQQLSPVTMSAAGVLYKKIRKVPLYTWVLDLWPESLTAAGGIKNKYILGFFNHFVKQEYKHSEKILVSSKSFEESICTYGDYKDKVIYYPQWAEDGILNNSSIDCNLPTLPEGFKIMFAGAVGEAHGFECNMQAALLTKPYKNIKWIIVGDGRRLEWVKTFVKEHQLEDTVYTLGRFPVETMGCFFEKADIMLVSLNDSPLFNLYAPAKISAYMAAKKPIIAVLNGEGKEVVELAECGWNIPAGNAEQLANLVIKLSQTESIILKNKGENGFTFYEKFFSKNKSMEKLDKIMEI